MKNTIDTTAKSTQALSPSRDEQLDLSFAASGYRRPACGRRQILRSRAQGWFDLMRRVVDNAVEWKPASLARPEQTALTFATANARRP
jgi:hypothetical protein